MNKAKFVTFIFVLVVLVSRQSQAELIDFRSGGNLGSVAGFDLNDSPPQTFSIVGQSSLTITFQSISSSSAGLPRINANGDRFGIDSTGAGSGSDDSDHFDAGLNEIVTFSFNQSVEITELDFVSFDNLDVFEFAGHTYLGTDTNLNGNDVLDLSGSPITLAANQNFTMRATTGSIGFQDMDLTVAAVPEPGSVAFLGLLFGAGFVFHKRRNRQVADTALAS